MIDVNDYITLVIHTPERAQILKNILESHGIEVVIEDFTSYKSPLTVAQRVKIKPTELPLALKITESGDTYSAAMIDMKMAGMSGNLLIPVDFSSGSMLAITIGFKLAKRIGLHPVVLHSFIAPMFSLSGANVLENDNIIDEIDNTEEIKDVREQASNNLIKFRTEIKQLQVSGKLPSIKFSTILTEGIAEEAIINYCKSTPPMLVVMATRGKDKKGEELIGSVTAEVLDSCRVPVFTIPDNCKWDRIEDITKLMMFCNMDQHDIMTIDSLMRIFDYPECSITLVPENSKGSNQLKYKLKALTEFFNGNYPASKSDYYVPSNSTFREEIDSIILKREIQLLIVPNKKTNVFNRIFHPNPAHKSLFERDMPMLAIPV